MLRPTFSVWKQFYKIFCWNQFLEWFFTAWKYNYEASFKRVFKGNLNKIASPIGSEYRWIRNWTPIISLLLLRKYECTLYLKPNSWFSWNNIPSDDNFECRPDPIEIGFTWKSLSHQENIWFLFQLFCLIGTSELFLPDTKFQFMQQQKTSLNIHCR